MGELLKLPQLLHHYFEHHDDDKGVSFFSFLKKHYSDEQSHPSPGNEHQRLPFKSPGAGCLHQGIVFQLPCCIETITAEATGTKELHGYNDQFTLSSIHTKIWQPPRSC